MPAADPRRIETVTMPAQSLAQNWQDWKESLDLSARRAPELYGEAAGDIGDTHAGLSVRPPGWRELYEDASEVGDTCYAGPLRTTLRDLGASAVFCVQGVPTAVFFAVEDEDAERIARLHSDLWNQGLASVLVVVCGHTIRIYSLAGFPANQDSRAFDEQCLVQTLDRVRDALEVRNLIRGIESGRYWRENEGKFNFEKRVDSVLLNNLKEADNRLRKTGLKQEESQALLMQTMFIAYLEDRRRIPDGYIEEATNGASSTFADILTSKKVTAFYDLFRALNRNFNGDLFVKPCSFGESGPRLQRSYLEVLTPFHSGKEEMHVAGSQRRLWGYNFEYIPVELISAVYDRFLDVRKQAFRASSIPRCTSRPASSRSYGTIRRSSPGKPRTTAGFSILRADPAFSWCACSSASASGGGRARDRRKSPGDAFSGYSIDCMVGTWTPARFASPCSPSM